MGELEIIDEELLEEFNQEALEGLDEAELLAVKMESEEGFAENFQSLFRVFHTIKGGAGMLQLPDLEKVVHHLETLMDRRRDQDRFGQEFIDYLLEGIDASRRLVDGESTEFALIDPEAKDSSPSEPKAPATASPQPAEGNPVTIAPRREISREESHDKIYVVDDDQSIREIICEIFEDNDFAVESFSSPEEALDSLKKTRKSDLPSCIVSDIQMTGMDGIEFLRCLKEKSIEVPVILISGYLNKERCMQGLAYGAFGFIEKPFDMIELRSMVKNAVKKAHLLQLVRKSIMFMLYQYGDIARILEKSDSPHLKELLEIELKNLLTYFRDFSGTMK